MTILGDATLIGSENSHSLGMQRTNPNPRPEARRPAMGRRTPGPLPSPRRALLPLQGSFRKPWRGVGVATGGDLRPAVHRWVLTPYLGPVAARPVYGVIPSEDPPTVQHIQSAVKGRSKCGRLIDTALRTQGPPDL